MKNITFMTSLLLSALVYPIHHFEEHILLNFRAWRSLYFPDSNQLSTETVLIILISVMLVYLITHSIVNSRGSAQIVILFLMATQANNFIFHVGGTIFFQHFSPGMVTAVLLYLPINALVLFKAYKEKFITIRSGICIFVLGSFLFWLFELVGPIFIAIGVFGSFIWLALTQLSKKAKDKDLSIEMTS